MKFTAQEIGALIARKLFHARGNKSEVHLNEVEVATACKVAVLVYIAAAKGARAPAAVADEPALLVRRLRRQWCGVCGETHTPPPCNDDFPEPGDIRETGR